MKTVDFPPLFRILSISNDNHKETIKAIVDEIKVQYDEQTIEIDFVHKNDVEKGMHLWQQQVFDLTFVQTDRISTLMHKEEDNAAKPWHHHISDHMGYTAIDSMKTLLLENNVYGFLENSCCVQELTKSTEYQAIKKTIVDMIVFFLGNYSSFTPQDVVARLVSLYRNKSLLDNEHSYAKQWLDRTLPSFDGHLIFSNKEFNWFEPIAVNSENKQYVYFTVRDPHDDMDLEMFCNMNPVHRIYLGPVSRDQKRPVWVLVRFLFELDEEEHKDRAKEQLDYIPLSSGHQISLQYRVIVPFKAPDDSLPEMNWPCKIEAAATPLTGVSTVGLKYAQETLLAKIKALLDGPFDSVVLKTVYKNKKDEAEVRWPALQAQSHHRTRCLRSIGHPRTLWNAGVTALEMFTPKMMNGFLKICANDNNFQQKDKHVIVSLGSKFPKATHVACYRDVDEPILHEAAFKYDIRQVWEQLFDTVFKNLDNRFPRVEINVRHYLRENVNFHIGGDEYLNPNEVRGPFTKSHTNALIEFCWWLEVLNDVAIRNSKTLTLKFPYRSDILAFIREVFDFYADQTQTPNNGTGIQGIGLINAFKSGVCDSGKGTDYTPAWYSRLYKGWPDVIAKRGKYQMSGEMLNASRNQLIQKVLEGKNEYGKDLKDFQLHFGGGVVSPDDIHHCCIPIPGDKGLKAKSIQVGTWTLLSLDLKEKGLSLACNIDPPQVCLVKPIVKSCEKACGKGSRACNNNVFSTAEKCTVVNEENCVGCEVCVHKCQSDKIRLVPRTTSDEKEIGPVSKPPSDQTMSSMKTKASEDTNNGNDLEIFEPRICYWLNDQCTGCGKCSKSFYCDTFLDREGRTRHPIMDSRNCTGCGLCTQICHKGALQLFEPKHVAVLISSLGERSDILRRKSIPHLTYESFDDLDLLKQGEEDSSATIINQAKEYINMEMVDTAKLIDWAIDLWCFRLDKDHFALMEKNEQYKDFRFVLLNDLMQGICIKKKIRSFALQLLEDMKLKEVGNVIEQSVAIRAFIWSQIIWSDPGQVLWESPIIVVRTTIDRQEQKHIIPPSIDSEVKRRLEELKNSDTDFTVISHYAVLKQGRLIERSCQKTDKLKLVINNKAIEDYSKVQLGRERLAGLDVRACPKMVKRNGEDLKPEEIYNIAGMPWEQLEKIKEIVDIKTEVGKRRTGVKQL